METKYTNLEGVRSRANMEEAFQNQTSLNGEQIGPYPARLVSPDFFAEKILAKIGGVVGSFGVLLYLLALVTPMPIIVILLSILMAIGGIPLCAYNLYFLYIKWRVAVPDFTRVYYRGQWYTQTFAMDAGDSGQSWPQMYYDRRVTPCWSTRPIQSQDGYTVTYEVRVAMRIRDASGLPEHGYFVDEYLYWALIEPTIVANVKAVRDSRNGLAFRSGAFEEAAETAIMAKVGPATAEFGLSIESVSLFRVNVVDTKTIAASYPLAVLSSGEQVMSQEADFAKELQKYRTNLPAFFDPQEIKNDMMRLRNTGALGKFVEVLKRRYSLDSERKLLDAWHDYYRSLGPALQASQAAYTALQRVEAEHRVFLYEQTAKAAEYCARIAQSEADIAEANTRKTKATKEAQDILALSLAQSGEKPIRKPSRDDLIQAEVTRREETLASYTQMRAKDIIDEEALQRFTDEVHERFEKKVNEIMEGRQ